MHAARAASLVACAMLVGGPASAEPAASTTKLEQRYDGPRLAFDIAAGTQLKEVADVAADYALELTSPASLAQTSLRVLVSNNKIPDADVEGVSAAWRDARLRNRASWGVRSRGASRAEMTHIGPRRFVRYADQMGSVLGAAGQIMLCGTISSRLVCAVASGPTANEQAAETLLTKVLASLVVKKRSEAK